MHVAELDPPDLRQGGHSILEHLTPAAVKERERERERGGGEGQRDGGEGEKESHITSGSFQSSFRICLRICEQQYTHNGIHTYIEAM